MKQYLLYCIGLPASGKSTFALETVKKEPNTIIVNRDSIRIALRGEYSNFNFNGKMEKLVTSIENSMIYEALKEGYSVISDNTNFRITDALIKEYQLAFPEVDVKVRRFDLDLKTCIQRDQQRERSVGKEIIQKFYKKYIDPSYEIQ